MVEIDDDLEVGVMRICVLVLVWAASAFADEPQMRREALRLEVLSIREARTAVSSAFMGLKDVTEWTVVTARANSRDEFLGGASSWVVLFVGETPCLPVWRDLRLSCIAPRVEGVKKLSLWGPREVGRRVSADVVKAWRARAEKAETVYALGAVPMMSKLEATDLNALIAQIESSPEL